jgi:hypothetical protein
MAHFTNAPAKTPVKAFDPGERFAQRSGPVKIIFRDGKVLDEPEIIPVSYADPDLSPYSNLRARKKEKT